MKWAKCRGIGGAAKKAGIRYRGPNLGDYKRNKRKACCRVPGVSYNCRKGFHSSCSKLHCTCTCGHYVG